MPPLHERVATFVDEHARAHDPQLSTSVFMFDSQPLSAVGAVGWVQLPYPATQVELQRPPLHERLATFSDEHARAHDPQLSALVFRFVSQPSSGVGAAGWEQFP